jgi:hypothetical protein
MEGDLRYAARVAGRFGRKRVVERCAQPLFDEVFAVNWQLMAKVEVKHAHIVEAEDMVGVVVREGDGVSQANLLAQQLLTKVGRGVDEQVPVREADCHTAPSAVVLRITASTDLAAAADHRDADAGAGAQEHELAADVGGEERARQVRNAGFGFKVQGSRFKVAGVLTLNFELRTWNREAALSARREADKLKG